MLADRDAAGNQVADPVRFPGGFKVIADSIHALGMKVGLYTARGPLTCQKRAASFNHEVQDAKNWAAWTVDYVKDDAVRFAAPQPCGEGPASSTLTPHPWKPPLYPLQCSPTPGYTDTQIYGRMWQAIQAAGRPMVLTVEGQPLDSVITLGGYGNAKRVGHDISPKYPSMSSLVDIGANLWMWSHPSTNPTYGGWWK